MSFLAPLFLFGLLAVAIPVAIHLIRREKPPRVNFSSIRFLKQTTKKLVLFQQIQQWLLLAIRTLLIALIVFAFARPLFYQTPMANLMDSEPQSLVLLIDSSLSMQYGEQFERARSEAERHIARLNPADEVAVISFSQAPRQVRDLSSDHAAMTGFLDGMDGPDYQVVRFQPALRLADELLASAQHDRQRVVMLSDFQASGMEGGDPSWMLGPGVAFETVNVGDERVRNLSLADVRAPAELREGVSEYEILARVRSTGTVAVDQARVSLIIDGETVALEPVDLSERSEAVVILPAEFEAGGQYAGQVHVSGDDFDIDNRFYFSVDVLPRSQVLVINGAPSDNWYEDAAHWFSLALEGLDTPYQARTVIQDDFTAAMLAGQDVVALLNTGSMSQAQQRALEQFVNQGGGLWLAPGERSDAQAFNEQFAELAPARLQSLERMSDNDYLLIADRDRRHPILAPLDVEWNARFRGYWQSEALPGSEVIMQFDNGAPAFLEMERGEGQVLMMTTPLDLSLSNLPLQGLYLPFVHEALDYLGDGQAGERAHRVGDLMDFRADLLADSSRDTVTLPDGQQLPVSLEASTLRAEQPGFFRLGEQEASVIHAVNIPPGAGDMRRIPASELHDRVINPETAPQRSERVRTAQLMQDIEQPQRLWWWILLLVLILLLLETRLANRTYR